MRRIPTELAVHIRLRRVGKTKALTYRVVIADSRAPRNGKFIETIGHYDPLSEPARLRSEEHTSELQSQSNLVCRLLLEKKNDGQLVRRRVHFQDLAGELFSGQRARHCEGEGTDDGDGRSQEHATPHPKARAEQNANQLPAITRWTRRFFA